MDEFLSFHDEGKNELFAETDDPSSDSSQFETSWSLNTILSEIASQESSSKKASLFGIVQEIAKIGMASATAVYSQATDLLPSHEIKGGHSVKQVAEDTSVLRDTNTLIDGNEEAGFTKSTEKKQSSLRIETALVKKSPSKEMEKLLFTMRSKRNDLEGEEYYSANANEETQLQSVLDDLSELTLPQGLLKNHFRCRFSLLGIELPQLPSSSGAHQEGSFGSRLAIKSTIRWPIFYFVL